MNVTDRLKLLDLKGRDFPILKGDVKMTLKNVHNGKTEVFEKHNLVTNALSDIFGNNYGGLVNYNSFADLYKTYLGGVLVFASALDSDPTNYGIPARTSNAVTAHAGQTPLTSQNDDTTRGNPDDSATVLTSGSTKLVWEWGTNAGNGQISALGLTHTDTGSFGSGVVSTAQRSLNPYAYVGNGSRSYSYGDNANCVLGLDGNFAYNFYLVDSTTVHIYKTPINRSKFKLQGEALVPLTDYTQMITATLPSSYEIGASGGCYYWFDFANNKLVLFGVPTAMGTTLYRDDISLSDGTVTHSSMTVTGAKLWKFRTKLSTWAADYSARHLLVPTPAIILGGYLYLYACSTVANVADKMFKINLSNSADIVEIDTTDAPLFTASEWADEWTRTSLRTTVLGGLIVNHSFVVNGDKVFPLVSASTDYQRSHNYIFNDGISSPTLGCNSDINTISVCKMFLATKWNLDSTVTKNASQSMTVEYTLTEV